MGEHSEVNGVVVPLDVLLRLQKELSALRVVSEHIQGDLKETRKELDTLKGQTKTLTQDISRLLDRGRGAVWVLLTLGAGLFYLADKFVFSVLK
jgi:hypothetical protein